MTDPPADYYQQLLTRVLQASPYGVNYCVLGAIASISHYWCTAPSSTAQAALVHWAAAAGFVISLICLIALAIWDVIEKLRAQCNTPPGTPPPAARHTPPAWPEGQPQDDESPAAPG
jgi:hypothetical protein